MFKIYGSELYFIIRLFYYYIKSLEIAEFIKLIINQSKVIFILVFMEFVKFMN